jgi:hypothetical protein
MWARGGNFRLTDSLKGNVRVKFSPGGTGTTIAPGDSSLIAGDFVLFKGPNGEAKIAKCVQGP